MIVDCALYREGRRDPRRLPPAEAAAAAREDGFVWIGLHEPTTAELAAVSAAFSLHELAVEDAIKAHQRPKLERFGETLVLVLKTARYVDHEEVVELGELLVFLGRTFVVVVRHGEAASLGDVRQALEAAPDGFAFGPTSVLHAILDRVVDGYGPVVADLGKDVDEVEEQVFTPGAPNPVERIYYLRREVLDFHRATAPLLEPLRRLSDRAVELEPLDPRAREYFRDVYDHLLRVSEQIGAYRDVLTSILEAYLAQIGLRQNEDMRKISAWVAIAAVPTMIAGVYGMNFQHMPELVSPFGYPVVMAVMLGACVGLWAFFRRRGWL